MLKNAENMALQNLLILSTFVFPLVIQKYTKLANFARPYFPHFSTFRDQILQFYYFYMLFSAVVMDFVFHVLIKI